MLAECKSAGDSRDAKRLEGAKTAADTLAADLKTASDGLTSDQADAARGLAEDLASAEADYTSGTATLQPRMATTRLVRMGSCRSALCDPFAERSAA
jgi:hypothetical protein